MSAPPGILPSVIDGAQRRDPDFATFLQEDEDYVDEMFVRPVIPLA